MDSWDTAAAFEQQPVREAPIQVYPAFSTGSHAIGPASPGETIKPRSAEGTSTAFSKTLHAFRPEPEFIIDSSAKGMITNRVETALPYILNILDQAASRYHIPVKAIRVIGFVDIEEDFGQLVIIQRVTVPAEIALPYWDKVGIMLEASCASFPRDVADIILERVALEVRWDE